MKKKKTTPLDEVPSSKRGRQRKPSTTPLPYIQITKETEILYVQLDMEMEDETFDTIADIGKSEITDQDYFEIGMRNCILRTIEEAKELK